MPLSTSSLLKREPASLQEMRLENDDTLCSYLALQILQSSIDTWKPPREPSPPYAAARETRDPKWVSSPGLLGSWTSMLPDQREDTSRAQATVLSPAPRSLGYSSYPAPVPPQKCFPPGWAVTSPLWRVGWRDSLTNLHVSLWLASAEPSKVLPSCPDPGWMPIASGRCPAG